MPVGRLRLVANTSGNNKKGGNPMKEVPLFGGQVALIDDEDYPLVEGFRWHTNAKGYATCCKYLGEYKNKIIFMHRLINKTPKGWDTDHINGNPLDNRKCNLRTASRSLNRHNWALLNNKGASYNKRKRKWETELKTKDSRKYLGAFNTKEEALAVHHKALREVVYA